MKDRPGKDIEGMMWMLGRLLLRHEDQMGIDKTENNFVMFFKKDSALSLVPTFVKKAEHWHSLKEQKQAKTDELALPLRTFLFHSMLEALLLRLKETTQSQDQLSTAMTLQVFLPKEENQDLMIPFLKFDPETKVLTPLPDRQEIAVTEMINKIQELQKLCLCQLVVLRFHSTQNPERMGRSALAVELAKRLQGSCPQFRESSEFAIAPITAMQTLLCVHSAGLSNSFPRHR